MTAQRPILTPPFVVFFSPPSHSRQPWIQERFSQAGRCDPLPPSQAHLNIHTWRNSQRRKNLPTLWVEERTWDSTKGLFSLCTFDQVLDSIGGWNYGLLNKKRWCWFRCVCLWLCVKFILGFQGLTALGLWQACCTTPAHRKRNALTSFRSPSLRTAQSSAVRRGQTWRKAGGWKAEAKMGRKRMRGEPVRG